MNAHIGSSMQHDVDVGGEITRSVTKRLQTMIGKCLTFGFDDVHSEALRWVISTLVGFVNCISKALLSGVGRLLTFSAVFSPPLLPTSSRLIHLRKLLTPVKGADRSSLTSTFDIKGVSVWPCICTTS